MIAYKLKQYRCLLEQWNDACGLIQKDSVQHFLTRHIEDSIQLLSFLEDDEKIIDIGTGGGFPGIVLSIYGKNNVVLSEISYKKSRFLQTVINELKLNCKIFNDDVNKFDGTDYTSVSRAFGSLTELITVMKNINSEKGFFHKGETYQQEIKDAFKQYIFDFSSIKNRADPNGVILMINKKWGKHV